MYVGILLVEHVLEATWHLNALKLAFFEVRFALKYPYAIWRLSHFTFYNLQSSGE